MGGCPTSTRQLYVPPPPGGFTNPATSGFVLADNYKGPAPAGFPRGNSTLLDNPVQVHPEPRIGVAWRPFSSRDIVVRSGYGIYANRLSFFGGAINLAFLPPFQFSKTSDRRRQCGSPTCNNHFPHCRRHRRFPTSSARCCQVRRTRGSHSSPGRFHGCQTSRRRQLSTTVWRFSLSTRAICSRSPTPARTGTHLAVITGQQPARPGQSHESCKWVDHQLSRECRRASSFSRYRPPCV